MRELTGIISRWIHNAAIVLLVLGGAALYVFLIIGSFIKGEWLTALFIILAPFLFIGVMIGCVFLATCAVSEGLSYHHKSEKEAFEAARNFPIPGLRAVFYSAVKGKYDKYFEGTTVPGDVSDWVVFSKMTKEQVKAWNEEVAPQTGVAIDLRERVTVPYVSDGKAMKIKDDCTQGS